MVWFVIGLLVVIAGGAGVLFLVLHMTSDHVAPAPFADEDGDDDSPLGSTSQHAGNTADSAAAMEGEDAHDPPDAPGAPSADVLPVGRYQAADSSDT